MDRNEKYTIRKVTIPANACNKNNVFQMSPLHMYTHEKLRVFTFSIVIHKIYMVQQ